MTTETVQIRNAWDGIASGFDEFVTPLTMTLSEEVLRRVDLRPGTRFLDVAAGSGAMAVPAARRGAEVVATDISPVMVEKLEQRARREGLANLEARTMDGMALQLESNSFDVAASQNGVSLFADLMQGISELTRVIKPGGKVLLVAFGSPAKAEFITFFIQAMYKVIPEFSGLPSDPPPLAFQLSDPGVMHRRLSEAGLRDVEVGTATWSSTFESGAHLLQAVTNSNPIARLMVADLSEKQLAEIRQALDHALAERAGGSGPAVLTTVLNVGVGRKQGVEDKL